MLHKAFIIQHFAEVVGWRRIVLLQVEEAARELVEGLRCLLEVVNIEYGLGVRQVIFLEIVIQSGLGAAEIRNSGAYANARASHDGDSLKQFVLHAGKE